MSSGVSIGGSLHRSTHAGASWESVFNTDFVADIAVSPDFASDRTVYATGKQGHIVRSAEAGAVDTWSEVGTFPTGVFSPGITDVALPPANTYAGGPVFAGGQRLDHAIDGVDGRLFGQGCLRRSTSGRIGIDNGGNVRSMTVPADEPACTSTTSPS